MDNHWDTKKNNFKDALGWKLEELKDECEKWTIDVIVLWWNNRKNFKEYKKSIDNLSKIITNELWFQPVVVGGPTILEWETYTNKWIFVDTENRRVHLYKKHDVASSNINYIASDIKSAISQI